MRTDQALTDYVQGVPFSIEATPFQRYELSALRNPDYFFSFLFANYIYHLFTQCYLEMGFSKKIPHEKKIAYWVKKQIENLKFDDEKLEEKLHFFLSGIQYWHNYLGNNIDSESRLPKEVQIERNRSMQKILLSIDVTVSNYIKARIENYVFSPVPVSQEELIIENNTDEIRRFASSQLPIAAHAFTPEFAKQLYRMITDFHRRSVPEISDLYPRKEWDELHDLIENTESFSDNVLLNRLLFNLNKIFTEITGISPACAVLTDECIKKIIVYLNHTQPSLFQVSYKKQLKMFQENLQILEKEKAHIQYGQCKNHLLMSLCCVNAIAQLPINIAWILFGWLQCYNVPDNRDYTISLCHYYRMNQPKYDDDCRTLMPRSEYFVFFPVERKYGGEDGLESWICTPFSQISRIWKARRHLSEQTATCESRIEQNREWANELAKTYHMSMS